MTLLAPLMVAAAGALCVAAILQYRDIAAPLWLTASALGLALASGSLSLTFFAWRLAGGSATSYGAVGWILVGISAALALPRLLASRNDWNDREEKTGRLWAPGVWIPALFLATSFIIGFVIATRQLPLGGFDAWAIWSSRARLIYLSPDLEFAFAHLRGAHPDYPWLLPGTLAALFSMTGSTDPRIPQIAGALFFASAGLATAWGVRILGGSASWATVAAALFLTTPQAVTWGFAQCADVPLAYVTVCAAAVLALVARRSKAPPIPLFAAGLLAGLPTWTKNEGVFLSSILVVAFALTAPIRGGGFKRSSVVALGAAVPAAASIVFRWRFDPQSDVGYFMKDAVVRALEPERWGIVAHAFSERLSPATGFRGWGVLWVALALLLAAGIASREGRYRIELRLLGLATATAWCSWFGVFLGMPTNLRWQIDTSLDRLMLQLVPLSVVTALSWAWSRTCEPAGGREKPVHDERRALSSKRGCPSTIASLSTVVMVCGVAGCTSPAPEPTTWRMIQPARLPDWPAVTIREESTVLTFEPLLDTHSGDGWSGPAGAHETEGGIAWTNVARTQSHFRRVVKFDARGVDAMVVRTRGSFAGEVRLYWSAPDGRFTQADSLPAATPKQIGPEEYEHRFELQDAQRWNGFIERLRITIRARGDAPHDLVLGALEARRSVPRSAVLSTASKDFWRARLGHESRDALLCSPGEAREWALSRLPGSGPIELRFAFGTEKLAAGAVDFVIYADASRRGPPLWEATVGATDYPGGRWHDAQIALDSPPATLSFECSHRGGMGSTRAVAMWASPELSRDAPTDRPNLVLVSIDTLRPDHLSLYGYGQVTSPNLDLWAADAVVFEHAVTSAPWTLPAHVSMFSGLDAPRHGVHHAVRVPDAVPLVAEVLRNAGYSTAAWVGGGFLGPHFGLDRGFDRYRSWPERAGETELEDGVARALEWIESSPSEPFFLFFHTYEVHHPYRPREPFFSRLAPEKTRALGSLAYVSTRGESFRLEKSWRSGDGASQRPLTESEAHSLRAMYDSGVAFTDNRIAMLLRRLTRGPLGKRTVVIVTSDHGEALGEKGLAGHAYLEEFNSLVPLIVRLPDGAAGRVATQVRLSDVAPTLLSLARIPPPAGIDAKSLLPLIDGSETADRPATTYAAFSNRGLAVRPDRRWKLVFDDTALAPLAGRTLLFDLAHDPQEDSPVDDPSRARALRQQAQRVIDTMNGALRLRVMNRSGGRLSGRLAGSAIRPLQVKAAEMPSSGLETIPRRGMHWVLAPGEDLEILLQNPREGRLLIDVDGQRVAGLDSRDLLSGWRSQRVDGRWTSAEESDLGDAIIEIEWPTEVSGVSADPVEFDDELRRQLEALGYIQ